MRFCSSTIGDVIFVMPSSLPGSRFQQTSWISTSKVGATWPSMLLLNHQLRIAFSFFKTILTKSTYFSISNLPSYVPIAPKDASNLCPSCQVRLRPSKRSHFGIFFPNPDCDRADLSNDFRSKASVGSQIHVVGEPLMAGYMLEMKRHFDIQNDRELRALVRLGSIDSTDLHRDDDLDAMMRDYVPKSIVERVADSVPPPPRGQDVRAPIDGVNTKRCQEWTMEFLKVLTQKGLISSDAMEIAQCERDSPTHGIFRYKN